MNLEAMIDIGKDLDILPDDSVTSKIFQTPENFEVGGGNMMPDHQGGDQDDPHVQPDPFNDQADQDQSAMFQDATYDMEMSVSAPQPIDDD